MIMYTTDKRIKRRWIKETLRIPGLKILYSVILQNNRAKSH